MIDTDAHLLERLKNLSAHEAWRTFFDLYAPPILSYAQKIGLSECQAADVLQETMVLLIRILPGFDYDTQRGRVRNFLLTIVHRRSLNCLRRQRGLQERQLSLHASPETPQHELAPGGTDMAEEDLKRWKESLVEQALNELRLDPSIELRTWRIFDAHVLRHRSIEEVSQDFAVNANAIYQIKNRMLKRLRLRVSQLLRDSGSEIPDSLFEGEENLT